MASYQVSPELLEDVDDLQIVRADAQLLFGHGLLYAHQPDRNTPEWWNLASMSVLMNKLICENVDITKWYDDAFESLYERNVKECSQLFQGPKDNRFQEVINSIRLALVSIRKLAILITYSKESIDDLEGGIKTLC
ncbi:hypothetical protein CJF30_00007585 [Rutstroemia sp. NJR-2017a BBW]|nr:hypothetical protein CJF30_00007585 [Rutstroemia sp. NJR-2017a BBW]